MKFTIMKITLTEKLKLWVILLVSFLVQIPSIIWGFELCDSGFYLTFYDNIFSHPESVQYNFMYYMNGLLGWLLLRLSGGSLLGIRIAGALVNVAVAGMAWSLIKGRGRFLPAICGVALIGIGSWGCTLTFNYDLATLLLASTSLLLLVKAIARMDKLSWDGRRDGGLLLLLICSGLVCGMNAFSRLPNFIDILFVFIIPLCARGRRWSKPVLGRMGEWLCGWCAGVAAVLLFALVAGHWDALVSSATSMLQAGGSGGGESIHSVKHLISVNIKVWVGISVRALIFAILVFAAAACVRRCWLGASSQRVVAGLVVAVVTGACFISFVVCRDRCVDIAMQWLFAVAVGGSMVAWKLAGKGFRRLRVVALCGLFMVLLLPAGSDGVVYGPGPLLLGFLLPASLCAVDAYIGGRAGRTVVVGFSLYIAAAFSIGLLGNGIIYFDSDPVLKMDSRMDVPKTGGILTSEANAELYDGLFAELGKYVAKGDTLMVYGSGPMVNYLTGTLPALGCSWPEQFTPTQLRAWLAKSAAPQYVMLLKFQTLGKVNLSKPDRFVLGYVIDGDGREHADNIYHSPEKSGIVYDYLRDKDYRLISDNPYFLLYKR